MTRVRSGYTLLEILIAAGITGAFLAGVFGLYRSGSVAFNAGTWKSHSQKQSQLFLEELRGILEKGGNATVADGNDVSFTPLPVMLARRASPTLNLSSIGAGESVLIAFIQMTTPSTVRSAHARTREPGQWIGVVLIAHGDNRLTMRSHNNPADLPPEFMGSALAINGVDFVGARAGSFQALSHLEDVSTVSFTTFENDQGTQLRASLQLTRERFGTTTSLTQAISAKLLDGVSVSWF